MAGTFLLRAENAHHQLFPHGQDAVSLVAHCVLVGPDHVVTGQHPGIAALVVHQPAAAHADLAILHRVLVEAVEGLLGGLRVVRSLDVVANLLLEATGQGMNHEPDCQHHQQNADDAHKTIHKGVLAVDFAVGQHQRKGCAVVKQTDIIIAKTGVNEVIFPQLPGLIIHGLQRAAHRHVGAVPLITAVLVIDKPLGIGNDRLGVADFGLGHFHTDVDGGIGGVDRHDVLAGADLVRPAALAHDGLGVVVNQGVNVCFEILSLQGKDVVVIQRCEMGRPSDHFCDAGPEHHADEDGRHSQDDDGPQLADQGFLLQGLQHRYFPPFFCVQGSLLL